jgi:hypothetical protein
MKQLKNLAAGCKDSSIPHEDFLFLPAYQPRFVANCTFVPLWGTSAEQGAMKRK